MPNSPVSVRVQPSSPSPRSSREAYWRDLLADWQRSDLTRSEFCRRRGVVEGTFAWWQRQVRLRDAAAIGTTAPTSRPRIVRRSDSLVRAESRFVPVRVVPTRERDSAPIEIVLAGSRRVRVSAGFDRDTLAAVVTLLEALPC